MFCYATLVFLVVAGSCGAHPSTDTAHHTNQIEPGIDVTVRSLGKECGAGAYSATCIKIEALALLERLSAKEELSLLPGVSVINEDKENNTNLKAEQMAAELARAFPGKPDERLDRYLLYRLGSYLDSHSVKLKLLDPQSAEEAKTSMSDIGDARRRGGGGGLGGGKKGGMGGIMAMAMMMKGTLMSLGLGALALLAGKALMTAMMSLLLSAIIGLKSLTSGGGKSTTYEIVAKPIVSHAHSHSSSHDDGGGYGHSGYGRSYEPAPTRRRR